GLLVVLHIEGAHDVDAVPRLAAVRVRPPAVRLGERGAAVERAGPELEGAVARRGRADLPVHLPPDPDACREDGRTARRRGDDVAGLNAVAEEEAAGVEEGSADVADGEVGA